MSERDFGEELVHIYETGKQVMGIAGICHLCLDL